MSILLKMLLGWTIAMALFTLYTYIDMRHMHDQGFAIIGGFVLYVIGLVLIPGIWYIFFRKR